MPVLINKNTGEKKYFLDEEAGPLLSSGEYSLNTGESIAIQKEGKDKLYSVSGDDYENVYSKSRYKAADRDDVSEYIEYQRLKRKHDTIGQEILTGIEGAARGATFGLSDMALTGLGISDAENMRNRASINDTISTATEIGGAVAPALLSGGTSLIPKATLLATRSGRSAGLARSILSATPAGQAARLAEGIAARGASKGLLGRAGYRGLGTVVEGSLHGTTRAISSLALNDDVELNAEFITSQLLPDMLQGAVIGGIAGAGLEAVGSGLKVASEVVGKKVSKLSKAYTREEAKLFTKVSNKVKKLIGKEEDAIDDIFKGQSDMFKNAQAIREELSNVLHNEKFANSLDDVTRDKFDDYLRDISFRGTNEGGSITDTFEQMASEWIEKSKAGKLKPKELSELLDETIATARKMTDAREDLLKLGIEVPKFESSLVDNKFMDWMATAEGASLAANAMGIDVPRPDEIPYVGPVLGLMLASRLTGKGAGLLEKVSAVGGLIPGAGKLTKTVGLVDKAASKFDDKFVKFQNSLSKGIKKGASIAGSGARIARKGVVPSAVKLIQDSPTLSSLNEPDRSQRPLRLEKGSSASKSIESYRSESRDSVKERAAFMSKIQGLSNATSDITAKRAVIATLGEEGAEENPELARQIHDSFKRKVEFLQSKIPKDPMSDFMMGDSGWKPTTQEMTRFARYVRAIDDPMTLMDDVLSNEASIESVEAVKAVYPVLYQKMQTEASEMIMKVGAMNIPRNTRLGIFTVLEIPVDPTTTKEFGVAMARLSADKAEEEQAGPPSSAPSSTRTKIDFNSGTSTERIGSK